MKKFRMQPAAIFPHPEKGDKGCSQVYFAQVASPGTTHCDTIFFIDKQTTIIMAPQWQNKDISTRVRSKADGHGRPLSKVTKTKATKTPNPDKKKKTNPDELCENGVEKLILPIIEDLIAVIENKDDWCDGQKFLPALALLQSWVDDKNSKEKEKRQITPPPKPIAKTDVIKTFINPTIGYFDFIAANKSWCDKQNFSKACSILKTWSEKTTKALICKQGAANAISPIIDQLNVVLAKKGTWCDGKRFIPARDLLQDYLNTFQAEQKAEKKTGKKAVAQCG